MTAGVKNVETTFNKATSTFSHTPDYSTNSSPSSYTTANAEDVTSEREFGGTWASKREARIGNQYPEHYQSGKLWQKPADAFERTPRGQGLWQG